jgi:nucleoside-diphosphate-sugar epimerase
MTILVTGADGYMGWPLILKLAKEFPNERIVGIDNFARRKWVEEVGSASIIPIVTMRERLKRAHELEFRNISFINGNLMDKEFTRTIMRVFKPDVVLHLAAQPSAPYSQINMDKAYYTQKNNVLGTLNLLWALRDEGLTKTHFIETTTTGIYGAPNLHIPEGFIEVFDKKGNKDVLPFPNIASSFYHVTKGFDAVNTWLMNMQTGMPCTDVRTSIVYGTDTEETKLDGKLSTRFDVDFYFGTLFNRWVAMIIANYPLTVYGSGKQIKPFISLEDACQSLVNIVKEGNDGEYRVYNQLVEYVRVKDLAEELTKVAEKVLGRNPGVEYIPNPRKEKEENEYRFDNSKFLKVLGKPKYKRMAETLPEVIKRLQKYSSRINAYSDVFIPKRVINK